MTYLHLLLDSVAPIERIKLSGELAGLIKILKSTSLSPIDRIKSTKRLGEILALLSGTIADYLSDDPNSPNYRYKDTGYIADSRKELAQSMIYTARRDGNRLRATDIDWESIEQNPRQAAELITKANLFGKTDWSELQADGMEPGAAFLISKIYASIGKEPSEAKSIGNANEALEQARALEDTPLSRRDYAFGLETIRDRLENKKTVDEVIAVVDEIRGELNGVQLSTDEADVYAKLSQEYNDLNNERVRLERSSDDVYHRHQSLNASMYRIRYDVENRKNRGWKPDPEKDKLLADSEAQLEKLWSEFSDIRNDVNPKSEVLKDQIMGIRAKRQAIVSSARKRNLAQNSATRAWLTFGERFLKLVNYRSFKGSDSFAGHLTNAKSGRIKDWSWADKDKPTKTRSATKQEINFQMRVADTYDRKGGKDISVNSTAELKNLIGFSDVQSGNWVLKDPNSAKFHVEQTAAAMSDMADMLGIDMSLLGYGGRLGMAFGARGTGGKNAARAHYEPVHRVMNLTKMGGGGSLGHEWFHSMDNIISEMVNGAVGSKSDFITTTPTLLPPGKLRDGITEVWRSMHAGDVQASETHRFTNIDIKSAKYNIEGSSSKRVPKLIREAGNATAAVNAFDAFAQQWNMGKKQKAAWRKLAVAYYYDGESSDDDSSVYTVKINTGESGSAFRAEAITLDDGIANKYWSKTEEMAARAFQAYIEDKLADADRRNDYLSAMADNKYYLDPFTGEQFKPFPEGDERTLINSAFDQFFEAIRNEKVFEKAVANNKLMDDIFGSAGAAD